MERTARRSDAVAVTTGLALRVATTGEGPRPTTTRFPRPTIVLWVGLALVAACMSLTALDVGGQAALWENAHWTAAGALAFVYASAVSERSDGPQARLSRLVALGTLAWFAGQIAWDVQILVGLFRVPAPSDIGFLMVVPPILVALTIALQGRLSRSASLAVSLDALALFLALSAMVLATFGDAIAQVAVPGSSVAVAYPIVHLATAAVGLVALLAVPTAIRSGGYVVLAGSALLGIAWVDWLRQAVVTVPPAGSLGNYLFSAGIIAVGLGSADWRLDAVAGPRFRRAAATILGGLPLFVLVFSALALITHQQTPGLDVVDITAISAIVLTGLRQTFLVHERGRLLDDSRDARRDLEIALTKRAEADSRYQVLVERVPAAVYIDVSDAAVSDGGRLAYMSPQIEAILGYPPKAFIDDPELWPRLMHPDDRTSTLAAYAEHWATEQPLRIDYRMVAADGAVVWVHDEAYAMREETSDGRRVSQGLLVNTTEQKRLEAQLLHDALHDPLTGLANRVLFRDHLDRALARSRRRRTSVAVLFLDIDDFKVINDSLGHGAGDRILIEVAQRLSATIRVEDVAARQGGDEFTVLVERVHDVHEAAELAGRLAEALRRPIELEGRSLVVQVSVGIALATSQGMVADDLLAHADAAMYAAKAQGKARHAVFDPSMRLRAQSRLAMEAELRAAIDAGAFELHYQPIIEIAGGRIVGFEALVRWQNPERGLIPPGEFIPLAEETGLIVPLGRWITGEACRRLRAWRDSDPSRSQLTVNVNVSPRQALEPVFASEVRDALRIARLEPAALVLEITESLTLNESATADGSLRRLRDIGVQLEIDDFGTGFSALEYLKRFAVHGLKIDRSFVAGLGRSREDTAIVTATLAFASALGLSVTAEGVETQEQLDRLRELGCLRAQGFFFSRPIPADEVLGLLDTLLPLTATRVA